MLLSRILITGPLHLETPRVVVEEVMQAHGFVFASESGDFGSAAIPRAYIMKAIEKCNTTQATTLNNPPQAQDWSFIARFVNQKSSWKKDKLTEAFNFLQLFTSSDNSLEHIPVNFTVGEQTPAQPKSINACILYKICLEHKVRVTSQTGIGQMAYLVRLLQVETASLLRRVETFVREGARRGDLVNILALSSLQIEDPEQLDAVRSNSIPTTHEAVTYDKLERLKQPLSSVTDLQRIVTPNTPEGATALAAIIFNLDISKAQNPLREYHLLRVDGASNYRPSDLELLKLHQFNPALLDLRKSFNPLFPVSYYSDITRLAQKEGYKPSRNVPRGAVGAAEYEFLQISYVSDMFYSGKHPEAISFHTTPIYAEIVEETNSQLLVCYGRKEIAMRPILLAELHDLFDRNQNFANPFDTNAVFGSVAIEKLKLICVETGLEQERRLEDPSIAPASFVEAGSEAVLIRQRLLRAIKSVELFNTNIGQKARDFLLEYKRATHSMQEQINQTFQLLLEMTMYMRNWTGKGPFPVEGRPSDDSTTQRSTLAIVAFQEACDKLGRYGQLLLNLPLLRYRDEEYQASNKISDGLTIGERLNIVRGGEHVAGNVSSCIRLSSNWFGASAHRYMTLVGLDAPFSINRLRSIA
jgi:hypothetical protein